MANGLIKGDLKNGVYTIFDVETTGLDPAKGDRIIEIGAVRVEGLSIVDRFETFINPQRDIPPEASRINGIDDLMVFSAPKADEVLRDFFAFAGESCLVAHNLKFDLKFINAECQLAGRPVPGPEVNMLDTLELSREFLPNMGRYSLAYLADALGISTPQQHRSMADVEMTFTLFCHLIKIADQRGATQPLK